MRRKQKKLWVFGIIPLSVAITITHAWLTPNPSNIRNGLPGLIVEEDTQSDMPLKFTGQKQFVLTSLDELGRANKAHIQLRWDDRAKEEREPRLSYNPLTITAGQTLLVDGDKLANTAVQGQISITKKGVESGDKLWNGNYSLAGNEFKLASLTDGKTYTITTDQNGKATTGKLPLGKYKIEETKVSKGFVNTFKPVEVELTYKDNQTELVFDEATGTNQEIKGQNKLSKEDKETGKDQDGLGNMKTAQYALYYNDTSTGSSPHQANRPVKWADIPKAKLLAGEKVTSGVVNGSSVNYGDNVVIDVDDTSFD